MARQLPNGAHAIYVLNLTEIARRDVSYVGVKAAHLGELARAGFPAAGAHCRQRLVLLLA
jgi:phosphoenolpyruvate synthase/pyruvate phosphate dikinase